MVSDARLKDVVGDFPLGTEELMQLRPRIFRYNGLAGTEGNGRLYVGIIAQELPEPLVPYCRHRAEVLLRPTDEELTQIFMLDHSSLPFVCINAIQEHEGRIRAFEERAFVGRALPRCLQRRASMALLAAAVLLCGLLGVIVMHRASPMLSLPPSPPPLLTGPPSQAPSALRPPTSPQKPPPLAPGSDLVKVCDEVISHQRPERCSIYSFDVADQVGAVANEAECRRWCEADSRCRFYAYWTINWCALWPAGQPPPLPWEQRHMSPPTLLGS